MKREEGRIKQSHFIDEFLRSTTFSDATSNLELHSQPQQMKKCKEQFQKSIHKEIKTVYKTVDEFHSNHWESEAWKEYSSTAKSKST